MIWKRSEISLLWILHSTPGFSQWMYWQQWNDWRTSRTQAGWCRNKKPVIREILFGNYRIVYRVKRDLVELLTVYHGARLFDPSKLT